MLEGLTPDLAPRLVLAIGGVGIALVVLVLVLIFLKRRNSPLFIKGGKSREPRLLVLDAAAVDPKRRLVLIRRDEVEHLIMIGGPTDIVIESGITDRSKPAARATVVDDPILPRALPVSPAADARHAPPVVERRPEPARPIPAPTPERAAAKPAEPRAGSTVVAPAPRPSAPLVAPVEKPVPSINRVMEEPRLDHDRLDDNGVSAVGAMLYGEDREPAPPVRSLATPTTPSFAQGATRATPLAPAKDEARAEPVASVTNAAEAVLDAARSRVLAAPQIHSRAMPEAEQAVARAEPPQADAFRRVQSATPAAAPKVQPATSQAGRSEPGSDVAKMRDADPSDFEKLLEAELDASGVFGQQPPLVRGESRVTSAAAIDPALAPTRRAPPITGATPDLNSETEVARLLGEIAVNRKT